MFSSLRRIIGLYNKINVLETKITDLRDDLAEADATLDDLGQELNRANQFISSRGLMAVYDPAKIAFSADSAETVGFADPTTQTGVK